MILGLFSRIISSPFVARIIAPALANALAEFLRGQAGRLELRGAVKQAKAAKTAEELREASRRLSDTSNRL